MSVWVLLLQELLLVIARGSREAHFRRRRAGVRCDGGGSDGAAANAKELLLVLPPRLLLQLLLPEHWVDNDRVGAADDATALNDTAPSATGEEGPAAVLPLASSHSITAPAIHYGHVEISQVLVLVLVRRLVRHVSVGVNGLRRERWRDNFAGVAPQVRVRVVVRWRRAASAAASSSAASVVVVRAEQLV